MGIINIVHYLIERKAKNLVLRYPEVALNVRFYGKEKEATTWLDNSKGLKKRLREHKDCAVCGELGSTLTQNESKLQKILEDKENDPMRYGCVMAF